MGQNYYERYAEDCTAFICDTCNCPLEPGEVVLQYMGNDFPVEMPRCPSCGIFLLPEELVTGKILEVEQALEDK